MGYKYYNYFIAPTGGLVTQRIMRRLAAQRHHTVSDLCSSCSRLCCLCHFCGGFFFSVSAEDTNQIPEILGLSTGAGTMIYAGSIGTQIANELVDSYRYIPLKSSANRILSSKERESLFLDKERLDMPNQLIQSVQKCTQLPAH